jgi:hypothetical protein
MSNIFKNTSAVIHPVVLRPTPQSSETVFVISDTILSYGYITMGGNISPPAEKVNMAFTLLQGFHQVQTHFCPLCMLKLFQPLGIIENLIHHHRKLLLGPEKCPKTFYITTNQMQPTTEEEKMLCWETQDT